MSLKINKIENDTEEGRLLNELLTIPGVRESYVEIGEEKFVLPNHFIKNYDIINQFEVRDDDVFIAGHPRSGTTVIHDMIDIIVNNFDIEHAKKRNAFRLLFLDLPLMYDLEEVHFFKSEQGIIELINAASSPRCIKTHLPWFLLPEQIRNGLKAPKIVLCMRNPKDVCISYYHHARSIDGYLGNFEDFCKLFLSGKLLNGSYFTTVKSYWEKRNQANVLCIRYSDMKKDLAGTIRTTAAAFGKAPTDKQVNEMVQYLSFNSWKKHSSNSLTDFLTNFTQRYNIPSVKSDFARAGVEGGFSSVMSTELIEMFDTKTKQEFKGLDLNFD